MSNMYLGSALCEVGEDGTVTMPEFLTDALARDAAELLVSKHAAEGCLIGYGHEHLETLSARTEARRLAGETRGEDARNHTLRMRRTFGIVEKMTRTGATITIPAAMRHLGKIGTLALFVGAGDSFEIWNPDLAIESDDEQFRDLATFRLNSRGQHDAQGGH